MDDSGPPLFAGRQFVLVVAAIAAVFVWVVGIRYCERIALERNYKLWVARLVGVLLPVFGPGIYWLVGTREPPAQPPEE